MRAKIARLHNGEMEEAVAEGQERASPRRREEEAVADEDVVHDGLPTQAEACMVGGRHLASRGGRALRADIGLVRKPGGVGGKEPGTHNRCQAGRADREPTHPGKRTKMPINRTRGDCPPKLSWS